MRGKARGGSYAERLALLAMCAPIPEFPAWDPATPYDPTFMAILKNPPCDAPVWSPETDEEIAQPHEM